MKHSFLILMVFMLISGNSGNSAATCDKNDGNIKSNTKIEKNSENMANNKIRIRVNSKIFEATISDNNTAEAFKEMLPLTTSMTELNGNEKYFDLSTNLPKNSSNPGTIQNGDLMLYGSLRWYYSINLFPHRIVTPGLGGLKILPA